MPKLSDLAWRQALPVIRATVRHPFNQELACGELALNRFAYYIEQDTLYLRDYARSLAMIAARAPLEYTRDYLRFADNALLAEQSLVHQHFTEKFQLTKTGHTTPSTVAYTNYLTQTSRAGAVEIAIAAHLPCFWVYRFVGMSIARQAHHLSQNRYARWIETYASEDFGRNVARAIEIFDTVGNHTNGQTQRLMLQAFYQSTVMEWHFWNDAYQLTKLGRIRPPTASQDFSNTDASTRDRRAACRR